MNLDLFSPEPADDKVAGIPSKEMLNPTARSFIEFALAEEAVLFGQYQTKAGRNSPYFFNAARFHEGGLLAALGRFYALTLQQSGLAFDMLFGPAYKGIPLVCATAIAMAQEGINVPFAFNRKEAKDHGEGGVVVGAPLQGRVVIVDDVVSAGISVKESIALIENAGATPAAVLIALDRREVMMEDGGQGKSGSATQEISERYGIPVIAIATVADLLPYAEGPQQEAMLTYLERYGAPGA